MRKILPLLLAATSVFGAQVLSVAPDLTIRMDRKPDLHLSAYRGKVVLLALLNTGCEHCQHFAQELATFQKDYAAKGVQVLAVVFDRNARSGLADFRTKYVKGFPVGYTDEETAIKWIGPSAEQGYFVPIVAFIDRRGRIASLHLGDDALFQDPERNIRARLDKLLKTGL